MDHSFEEIRSAALDLLAGREMSSHDLTQYQQLLVGVGEVFERREAAPQSQRRYQGLGVFGSGNLSQRDQDLFLEVFWALFREGIITLGLSKVMSIANAASAAIFARIVLILAELIFLGICFSLTKRK